MLGAAFAPIVNAALAMFNDGPFDNDELCRQTVFE